MPQISKTSTPEQFSLLRQSSCKHQERNDCAVIAVAVVCDVSYDVAHAALALLGRKRGEGTLNTMTHRAIIKLGKCLRRIECRDMIASYPGNHKKMRSVTTHHFRRFAQCWDNTKVYLVQVRGHILAVKGGVVQDWTINRSKRVISIYEVW